MWEIALLDNGSDFSIIGNELAKHCDKLKLPYNVWDKNKKGLVLANGNTLQPVGTYKVPVSILNIKKIIDIVYIKDFKYNLILGLDFFQTFKLIINNNKRSITTPFIKNKTFNLYYIQNSKVTNSLSPQPHNVLNKIITSDPTYNKTKTDFRQNDIDLFKHLYYSESEAPQTVTKPNHSVIPAKISQVIDRFQGLFSGQPGVTDIELHRINLIQNRPINLRPYRSSPAKRQEIERLVGEMLENGIIRESYSEYASPVVLVEKKDSTATAKNYRFCVDYRKLNNITVKESYPLPRIDDCLEFLSNKPFLSVLDARSGYWNIKINPDDIHKTAFITHNGKYEFLRMPFGLCNAPYTFMRAMNGVLGRFLNKNCVVYLDDIIVASPNLEQHKIDLENIFSTLKKFGFTLNKDKCHFCVSELVILGHLVTPQGISPNPKKVEAIVKYPTLASRKDVERFMGMAGYYRRFIPHFSTIAKPLTSLLKKNTKFIWTESCEQAFFKLKNKLTESPILIYPDYSKPFVLTTDASSVGLSAILAQPSEIKNKNLVIAYASRALSTAEQKYSASERECLGVIFGIEHFRPYLEGMKFTVVTDHNALCWLRSIKDPHGKLGRWSLRLQNLDYEVVHQPGKENKVADALSRAPLPLDVNPDDDKNFLMITSTPISSVNSSNRSVNTSYFENKFMELERLQNEDKDITVLIKLKNNIPVVVESNKVKDFFELHKDNLIFVNNVLYLQKNNNLLTNKRKFLLLLPLSQVDKVLKSFHDSPLGGHMGVGKTLSRIKRRYVWIGMSTSVKQYVRSCTTCQLVKTSNRKPIGIMQSVHATRPMQYLALDFIGPLPRSVGGHRYVIIFIDLFTKWIEAFPIKDATAKQAASKLLEVVYRHGIPQTVITDRGTQFTSNEFNDTLCSLNIQHNKTSIHHPEANQAERAIRTVKSLIKCYLEGRHNTWDEHLNEILFAIRSAPQESTGESPCYLIYGRDLDFPIDNEFVFPDDIREDAIDFGRVSMVERIGLLHSLANKRLVEAHKRQAKYYSQRRRIHSFRIGDLVKVIDYTPSSGPKKMSAKLSPRFKGPFRVSRRTAENNYELKFVHNNNIFGMRHAQQIEPYFIRDQRNADVSALHPSQSELVQNLPPNLTTTVDSTIGSTLDSTLDSTIGDSTIERMFGPTRSDESSLHIIRI